MSFDYVSNTTPERIASRLRSASRVFVTTHAKPDGDAVGSVVAIVRACAAIGRDAEGWIVGPTEPNVLQLAAPTALTVIDPKRPRVPADDAGFDLVVITDTGAWSQLEALAPWLRPRVDIAVGLDHHARGDEVASERIVDTRAGSATSVVVRVVDALGVPLEYGADARGHGSIAEALYLGLATDTGWFRFPNAGPDEFRLAARLLAAKVDKDRVVEIIEQSHRPQRLAIEAKALASVRYLRDGRVALMRIGSGDLRQTGATVEELSGVVNLPMAVREVRASILLVEQEPGVVKFSFRSKPEDGDGSMIDVNELAAKFGGGGHVHAAGARMRGSLDEAQSRVEAEVAKL